MNDERRFVEDLSAPGLLHAVVIRSPYARARLLGIEIPRLPHACALIRAEDIPGENRLEAFGNSISILAKDRLSYIGEPVALLVGPDRVTLERLLASAAIRAEEETPVFAYEKFSSDQLAAKRTAVMGDPDAAFGAAVQVVEGVYRTGRQEHWYAEPNGALAAFAYDKLEVSVATQWPFHVRRTVSSALDVKQEDVVVSPCEVGVHLDGKLWYPSLVAAHAALGAIICKKPVKLLLTREEDVRFSPKRPAVTIRHRAAIGSNGELLALESRSVVEIGAAAPFTEETLDRLCLGSLGAYRCPNVRLEGFAVRTDTPPTGPFAGLGLSQSFFAIERHATRVAEASGMDPARWRAENALGRNDTLASGIALKEAVPAEDLINTAVSMSDYRRKWAAYELMKHSRAKSGEGRRDGPLRGIGIAFAYQGNGFLSTGADSTNYAVELTLEKDGSLEIRTSAVSGSRETAALWRRAAAEILTLEDGAVRLAANRTDESPDSGPSTLSRNVTIVTRLIERCCYAIRKQRFRDPLPITVKRSYRAPKTPGWDGLRMEGSPFPAFSWAAAVVETEIDLIDYRPRVRGVWISIDGGRILSERKARSSIEVATLHALGWASTEVVAQEAGTISAEEALAYPIAVPADAPSISVEFMWTDSISPKGIGELPFACVPAAFAQAVSQAAGNRFDSLPIRAEAIRNALEDR